MNNIEECIKRGTNGSAKASYAVRVGQKQARRTEYQHIQKKKEAWEEGWQGVTRSQTGSGPKQDLTQLMSKISGSHIVKIK